MEPIHKVLPRIAIPLFRDDALILLRPPGAKRGGQGHHLFLGRDHNEGYLASDVNLEGKRPGILVVHEWWGLNDYARKRARMLAELGYTALAVDMFGDGKTTDHPEEAGKFAMESMRSLDTARARFMAAYNLLKEQPGVDGERIGAIGYCFGGGVVLEMARTGADLRGVVSFHGSLGTQTPAERGAVKARLLVCSGGDDSFVTPDQVEQFKKEMNEAGVAYTFENFPGAKHAFTNPDADTYAEKYGLAVGYNKAADEKSWADMRAFFQEVLVR